MGAPFVQDYRYAKHYLRLGDLSKWIDLERFKEDLLMTDKTTLVYIGKLEAAQAQLRLARDMLDWRLGVVIDEGLDVDEQ